MTADINQSGVIDVARKHRQFATDYFILGAGVALDVDEVEVGLRTLINTVSHIDQPATGGGNLRNDERVDIALRTIEFLEGLQVAAQPVRRVKRAVDHLEARLEFVLGGHVDAVEAQAIDRILDPFADGEDEFDIVARERNDLDVGDLGVGKTFVLVGEADGVLVFLQLGRDEAATLVEEGEQVFRLGLHRLAQVLGQNRVVADEIDALHHLLVALVDGENNARVAGAVVHVDARGDVHPAEVAILVELDHRLAGLLDLLLAESVAHFEGHFLAQAIGRNFGGTFDENFGHDRAALHEDDDLDAVALRFGKNADVGNITRGEKRAHIFLGGPLGVRVAHLRLEVGHDALAADRFGPDILDIDRADDGAGRWGHLGRGVRQKRKRQQKCE